MKKINDFQMLLTQEITNLDRFIIKAPLGTNEFWSQWQEKAGQIVITKAAIKKALKIYKGKLPEEELIKLQAVLDSYREIASYLELLRETALRLKGVSADNWDIFDSIEDDDEIEF